MKFGRGAWIQYRAYTLTLLVGASRSRFPHFMQDSMFAHRSAHNPWAMLILSAAALVANVWVFVGARAQQSSPSGATPSPRRSTPTRPPTPRGSATSRPRRTRSSSPRAWARRPRRRALRPQAWGNRAALLRGCPPIAPLCRSEGSHVR